MNNLTRFLSKNRPSILTFVGLGGMVVTAVMAYKSYDAVQTRLYEALDSKHEEDPDANLTKREKAWVYVRTLWPTLAMGAISGALIAFGNHDHILRRNAAVAAYYISEKSLKDYQAEIVKEIGEKKEHEIRDRVAEKHMKELPANNQTVVMSESDRPWVCDTATGCYFRMSYEKLRRIIAEANLEHFKRDYISVADLYDMLEVPLPPGSDWFNVGWDSRCEIDPYFTSAVHEINGETVPCMVMEYRVRPYYDFDKYS